MLKLLGGPMTSPGRNNPHPGRIGHASRRSNLWSNLGTIRPVGLRSTVYVRSTYEVMSGGGKVFLIPRGHVSVAVYCLSVKCPDIEYRSPGSIRNPSVRSGIFPVAHPGKPKIAPGG
jgi:hypothetical protein